MNTLTPYKAVELVKMALQPDSGLSTADRAKLLERIVASLGHVLLLRHVDTRPTTSAEREALGESQDLLVTIEIPKGRKDLDIITRHYLSLVSILPKPSPVTLPNLSVGEWVIGKTDTQELVESLAFRPRPGFVGENMPEVRWTTDLGRAKRWTIHAEAEAVRAMLWDAGLAVDLFTAADFSIKPSST